MTKKIKKLFYVKVILVLLLTILLFNIGNFVFHNTKSYAAFNKNSIKPNALPSSFGLGISQGQGQNWGQNSGVPWTYAYQYFASGVNTGNGWETWNANGTFAPNWANEMDSYGFIPVVSYYEMLQSNGTCNGCSEAQKDLSNLNNTSTMTSYLNNFALLMKRLGTGNYDSVQGFGKTAILHFEPDLEGYAMQAVLNNGVCYSFCTNQGNNPAFLNAKVHSTNISDLSALDGQGNPVYPDTFQGFIWALLHLRDIYAPNVLFAFHVSAWATGTDIGSSSDPNIDVTTLSQTLATFINLSGGQTTPTGVSKLDLLFTDVLDRDAGYYKNVYGNPNVWWDRLNVNYPNFHRNQDFISIIHQNTSIPFILWQVPIGNQYFDTENNTNNHYQDNRVEYYLGQNLDYATNHIQELKNAGIIGILFGPGAGSQSSYTDQGPDGITNPASFCTTDGISSGQICNNHVSSYSDDDGGYLRIMAGQFYSSTTPIPTTTVPLRGDYNGDNKVNVIDLSILLTKLGTIDPTEIAKYDLNNSNSVNVIDLSIFLTLL